MLASSNQLVNAWTRFEKLIPAVFASKDFDAEAYLKTPDEFAATAEQMAALLQASGPAGLPAGAPPGLPGPGPGGPAQ